MNGFPKAALDIILEYLDEKKNNLKTTFWTRLLLYFHVWASMVEYVMLVLSLFVPHFSVFGTSVVIVAFPGYVYLYF